MMEEIEKQIIINIEKAIASVSEDKKQFFLGYAEGMSAMADLMASKNS